MVSNLEGKANTEPRPGRVQAASLGMEVSPLRVDPHSVRECSDISVSPTSPPKTVLQDVSLVGCGWIRHCISFLVDQGTEFLGNGLGRCYFHNSHPQGLGGGGGEDL